jgi:nitrite reductase/ring-hydroxylating ferredoxin subunit/uncharacterized membrane protein
MSTATAPSPLQSITDQVEQLDALDQPAQALGKKARETLPAGTLKDLLSGTWLGHPVHPILTDVVIGSFTSATILDLIGGERSAGGAQRLVGVGLAAYGPTALTGVNDWADSEPADEGIRRTGLVHAATNATAFTLYALSYRARRRGRRGAATLLGLAGAGALTAGGYLGGHLTYAQGVGVDQTRFDQGPTDWTPAIDGSQLEEGRPRTVVVEETPVMLVRVDGRVRALHDRCSHRGCSLGGAGEIQDGMVQCGCHGSRFDLDDGTVQRGPATTPQPAFEVGERGDRVEIRRRA